MRRHAWAALGALVVVAGLVGCVPAQPTNPPAERHTSPELTDKVSEAIVDLATRSGTWPATERTLETAANRLTRQCMAEHGFDQPEEPSQPPPSPNDEAGIIDLPGRREHGYEFASDSERDKSRSEASTYYEKLSPQEQRRFDIVLFGPSSSKKDVLIPGGRHVSSPAEGCLADSRRYLMGDVEAWTQVYYGAEHYGNQVADQAGVSPEFRRAVADWSACMTAKGHPYPTPDDARATMLDEQRQAQPGQSSRKLELAVAVADGECALEVHLPSTALQIRRRLVSSLPETDRQTLARLVKSRNAAVARATETIANR